MRRNTCRHADGNSLGTVDKEIRYFHRQHDRLFLRFIKVWNEIHHVFIEIRQKILLCDLLKPCLGITHGSGAVALNIAKISVPIDQREPFLEILCHDHQCVIDGAVAVRMVFTHGITYDTGALAVRSVVTDPQFMHIIKHPALHRF